MGRTQGPLRYIESVRCPFNDGYQVVTEYTWRVADGRRLQPGCSLAAEWHVIVGWLNQPVATIDYVKH